MFFLSLTGALVQKGEQYKGNLGNQGLFFSCYSTILEPASTKQRPRCSIFHWRGVSGNYNRVFEMRLDFCVRDGESRLSTEGKKITLPFQCCYMVKQKNSIRLLKTNTFSRRKKCADWISFVKIRQVPSTIPKYFKWSVELWNASSRFFFFLINIVNTLLLGNQNDILELNGVNLKIFSYSERGGDRNQVGEKNAHKRSATCGVTSLPPAFYTVVPDVSQQFCFLPLNKRKFYFLVYKLSYVRDGQQWINLASREVIKTVSSF